MLNIQTQCCGMLLLWIITYFFCRMKKVKVKTQTYFLCMLVIMNIGIVADIVSVCAIVYSSKLPTVLVDIICKIYLLTLVGALVFGLLYICADIYLNSARLRRTTLPFRIIVIVFCLAILILPVNYAFEGNGEVVYSYGPSVMATYIVAFLVLMTMISHLFRYYKKINPRRRTAVIMWVSIWIWATLFQYLYREFLVVSFAGVLGVMIIYVMIENPEADIDRNTGFFNIGAMVEYLLEGMVNGKAYALINIGMGDGIGKIIKQIKGARVFVGGGELFLVFSKGDPNIDSALDVMQAEAGEATLFYVPDSSLLGTEETLLEVIRTAQKMPKKEYRDRVFKIDKEFMDFLADRKRIENMIQEAIESDRIEVFYQPIYSVGEKRFRSAEALVRIKDTEGNIVPPNVFIPIAEDNGAIIEVGKIVIDKVCRFMAKHENGEMGLRYVEVNLSVVQGEDENLARDIIQIINRHGVSSKCVNLEITESASIRGKEQLLENMNELIRKGIDFSLDDFGTGQSNLDYMADMPVKLVKFDRKMTNGYFESEKVKHIMNAAIQMIHGMGMEIVAEGIETKEQLQCMLEQGIEYIQGYYFSRPVPEREFEIFLKENNCYY